LQLKIKINQLIKTKFKMRKSSIIILLIGITIISINSGFDILNDNGKAGKTGSPGEGTCTGCHTGAVLNDGMGLVTISSTDLINWQYTPGQTYSIDVNVTRTGSPLFGFDCECLNSNNQDAGTFIVTNSETQILNATVSSVIRKNMVHTLNGGNTVNMHTFSFKWKAPSTNIGNVTFYVTGNAANGNLITSGDHIYSTTQVVTPGTTEVLTTEQKNTGFSIYPNPAQQQFTVLFSASDNEKAIIKLFSMDGKEIEITEQLQTLGNTTSLEIQIPNVPKGVYMIQLQNGTSVKTQRIIIQ
jgi:hypothetical protein